MHFNGLAKLRNNAGMPQGATEKWLDALLRILLRIRFKTMFLIAQTILSPLAGGGRLENISKARQDPPFPVMERSP